MLVALLHDECDGKRHLRLDTRGVFNVSDTAARTHDSNTRERQCQAGLTGERQYKGITTRSPYMFSGNTFSMRSLLASLRVSAKPSSKMSDMRIAYTCGSGLIESTILYDNRDKEAGAMEGKHRCGRAATVCSTTPVFVCQSQT